jgi:photosystem II stability/assembly factor-like uncharacterized protein
MLLALFLAIAWPAPARATARASASSAQLPQGAATIVAGSAVSAAWAPSFASAGAVFSDGFEGGASAWTFRGSPTWATTTQRAAVGQHSTYCAGSSIAAPGPYANSMNAWRIAGPFDLSGLTAASVEFKLYRDTQQDADYIGWYASTDGADFRGWRISGKSQIWEDRTFDLTTVPTLGNLCGRSQVWIAFLFTSDASITAEGAYVDEVKLQADDWSKQSSGTTADLNGVAFSDSTHGWAVGDGGVIRATTDGGATWGPQASGTTEDLHAVAFGDATHGWAVGRFSLILTTTNGGATWSKQSGGEASGYWLTAVAFTDASHGSAVGQGGARWVNGIQEWFNVILDTNDGGARWGVHERTYYNSAPSLEAVAFGDATHGWAVGQQGTILATTDGGGAWNRQFPGAGASQWTTLRGVAFPDATHGWAVGDDSIGPVILATADGGATWRAQSPESSARLCAVAFSDATRGWAVGIGGAILATTDGGATWSRQSSGSSARLNAVVFPDATRGWAVGDGGVILATATGGVPPVAMPTVTGFTPASGPVGTSVTISGTGFSGATAVTFTGAPATTYAVVSATQITATVPAGATTGPLSVTTPGGTAASATSFTVTVPVPVPTLTFFTPTSGPVGTSVTLTGSGFTGVTAVTFTGAPATTYAVVSATQITATVPAGATTGPLTVTTPGGTAASATSFTVMTPPAPAPGITRLSPASAKRGATVTITGSDFAATRGTSTVKFGAKTCTNYVSWSATQIKCKVPAAAKYGAVKVTVKTTAGTSSAVSFTVKR